MLRLVGGLTRPAPGLEASQARLTDAAVPGRLRELEELAVCRHLGPFLGHARPPEKSVPEFSVLSWDVRGGSDVRGYVSPEGAGRGGRGWGFRFLASRNPDQERGQPRNDIAGIGSNVRDDLEGHFGR
jgi:hypothetical protein